MNGGVYMQASPESVKEAMNALEQRVGMSEVQPLGDFERDRTKDSQPIVDGPVAQSAEHLPFNGHPSSIPFPFIVDCSQRPPTSAAAITTCAYSEEP